MADETSPVREIKFESLTEGCLELERELGLPPDCLLDLPRELSDWSFVIKIAALVESAVTHLLTDEIDDERFRPLVSKLYMQGATGKLPLAKSLNIISRDEYAFSAGITGLRNTLAHDPRFLGFEFGEYLLSLPEPKRIDFFKWATRGKVYPLSDKHKMSGLRVQIWGQALVILAKANVTKATRSAQRRIDKMHKEVGQSFINTPPFVDETETG